MSKPGSRKTSECLPISDDLNHNPQTSNTEVVDNDKPQITLYFKRWFMLGIFCAFSFSSAFQWIHLNIIGDKILKYYNESLPSDVQAASNALNWLSMIYMLAYVVLIFPATWLLETKGIKVACCVGALLNALGAWIKCAAIAPDRFGVLMAGQTFSAIAQNFVLEIPPLLAAHWFGESEVSTATAIGVFGNQVGCAIGFFIPPAVVSGSSLSEIEGGLRFLLYGTAIFCTIIVVFIVFLFKSAPPTPPSLAQSTDEKQHDSGHNIGEYLKGLKALFTSVPFWLLTLSYGANTGCYYAIGTLLNPIILAYFEGADRDAGIIGLVLVLAGVVGSVLAGIFLDKTKRYKQTTLGIYLLSAVSMIGFTVSFYMKQLWIIYVLGGVLGFFMTGYLPVGFEFAAEITYPEPEGTSAGILNMSAQVFGLILTPLTQAIIGLGLSDLSTADATTRRQENVLKANSMLSVVLLVGTVLTAFIRGEYRRQMANQGQQVKSANMEDELETRDLMASPDVEFSDLDAVTARTEKV